MGTSTYQTPTGFKIPVISEYHDKLLQDAENIIGRLNESIKTDSKITDKPEFQFLVTQFAICGLGDLNDLLVANRDNDDLIHHQRELLSDLYRIGSGVDPQLSLNIRISLIKDDLNNNVTKSKSSLVIDSDIQLPVLSDENKWLNIIRTLSMFDIVCVTRAILGNRD